MIEKRSPFYAYRYMVTPMSDQTSLFQQLNKGKEELMFGIIHQLAKNKKTEWTRGNKRYLFYGFQSYNNIFIIKYARESQEKLYLEGDDDIEIQGVKEARYVYLIIDTMHQIVLLERNQNVFISINNCINNLADFFRFKMREFDYVVNIYPLVSNRKFWSYVDSADEIFELSLIMNAPNMAFFGYEDTREVLKQIKEATNNEEFDISFKNKEGKLKILREALGGWVDYVRDVGGRYSLKFSIDGVTETKTSETDTAKTYLKRKKTEKYDDNELKFIEQKVEALNRLESRDEAEE